MLFDESLQICLCKPGFYLDKQQGNSQCIRCVYPCLECQSRQSCLRCDQVFQLQSGSCQCPIGYVHFIVQESHTPTCKQCPAGCNVCDVFGECQKCSSSIDNLQLLNGQCVCTNNAIFNPEKLRCETPLQVTNITSQTATNKTVAITIQFNQPLKSPMVLSIPEDFLVQLSPLQENVDYYLSNKKFVILDSNLSESQLTNQISFNITFKDYVSNLHLDLKFNSNSSIMSSEGVGMASSDLNISVSLPNLLSDGSTLELSKSLSSASESLLKQDGNAIFNLLKDVQIFLYFINSIQATAIPLLLNTTYPIHLYETLRVISAFIFHSIPQWGENPPYTPPTLPFKHAISEIQFFPNQEPGYMFQRIGYSSNFLLNTASNILYIVVLWVLYYAVRFRYITLKQLKGKIFVNRTWWRLYYEMSFNYLLKIHETIVLNFCLSFFLQLYKPDFHSVFNSISFLLLLFSTFYQALYYINIYVQINKPYLLRNTVAKIKKYSSMVEDLKFNENQLNYYALTNRQLQDTYVEETPSLRRKLQKNYHFIGYLKKVMVVGVVVLLQG